MGPEKPNSASFIFQSALRVNITNSLADVWEVEVETGLVPVAQSLRSD